MNIVDKINKDLQSSYLIIENRYPIDAYWRFNVGEFECIVKHNDGQVNMCLIQEPLYRYDEQYSLLNFKDVNIKESIEVVCANLKMRIKKKEALKS